MKQGKSRLIIFIIEALLIYLQSYPILRVTKILIRREYLILTDVGTNLVREVYKSDIGNGKYFDENFKSRPDPLKYIYYPLGQMELMIRGKKFYEETVFDTSSIPHVKVK